MSLLILPRQNTTACDRLSQGNSAISVLSRPISPEKDTFTRFGARPKTFQQKFDQGMEAYHKGQFSSAYNCFLAAQKLANSENIVEQVHVLHCLGCVSPQVPGKDGKHYLNEGIQRAENNMEQGPEKLFLLATLQNELGKQIYSGGDLQKAGKVFNQAYENVLHAAQYNIESLLAEQTYWADINQFLGYIAEQEKAPVLAIHHYEAALAFQEKYKIKPYDQFHNLIMLGRLYNDLITPESSADLKQQRADSLQKAQDMVPEIVRLPRGDGLVTEMLTKLTETLISINEKARP